MYLVKPMHKCPVYYFYTFSWWEMSWGLGVDIGGGIYIKYDVLSPSPRLYINHTSRCKSHDDVFVL